VTSSLELRVTVPEPDQRGATCEIRPVVDGRDLLAEADFTEGPGIDPTKVGSLVATPDPHEVLLAEALCTEGCCGSINVTVRREGDQVLWTAWRNPDNEDLALPDFTFDAGDYDREITRAAADLSWEWPARTVARLLKADLSARTVWQQEWGFEVTAVSAWPWQRDQISVFLFSPDRAAIAAGRPYLQYRLALPVTDRDPAAQAAELAAQLTAGDPRTTAEICGRG
jgi:hypothetical protein